MAHSDWMQTDERSIGRIEQWALARDTINRVWPVKRNNCDAGFFAGAHAEIQRPDESVVARTDILKIDKQNIEILQHFRSRLAVFAVKAVNWNLKPRVLVTFPFHHVVLRLTEESVLRTKERSKPE
jgi:hypothetical protein